MICEFKSYCINNGISKNLCWVALGISVGAIFSFVRAPLSFGLMLGILGLSLVVMDVKLSFYWLIGLLPFLYFIKRIDVVFLGSSTAEFNSPMSLIPEIFCMVLFTYFLLIFNRKQCSIKPNKIITGSNISQTESLIDSNASLALNGILSTLFLIEIYTPKIDRTPTITIPGTIPPTNIFLMLICATTP